jgi:hypothetical protein
MRGLKRRLVDVLITHSNLLEAGGEVEMGVKVRVLKLIKRVVHTRKWVSVFTRNFIKATVVNAETERAISLAHKNNWRAELIVAGTSTASLRCRFSSVRPPCDNLLSR